MCASVPLEQQVPSAQKRLVLDGLPVKGVEPSHGNRRTSQITAVRTHLRKHAQTWYVGHRNVQIFIAMGYMGHRNV